MSFPAISHFYQISGYQHFYSLPHAFTVDKFKIMFRVPLPCFLWTFLFNEMAVSFGRFYLTVLIQLHNIIYTRNLGNYPGVFQENLQNRFGSYLDFCTWPGVWRLAILLHILRLIKCFVHYVTYWYLFIF